jgi:FkbM family methyltransferase
MSRQTARWLFVGGLKVALYPVHLLPQSVWKEYVRAALMAVDFRPPVFTLVNAGETVVQVGVAAPETVFRYSRAVGPQGRVVLFEAAPKNIEMIREAMRRLPYPNVVLIPKGAWSAAGTVELALSPLPADNKIPMDGIVHDNDFRPENDYSERIRIPVDTVDAVVSQLGLEQVHYLSITVNGAELEVLAGSARTLRHPGLRLWVKAHALQADGTPLNVPIGRLLRARGFRVFKTARSAAVGVNPGWRTRDGDVYAYRRA